ncbi:Aldehyde dehydrogenase [Patulibacter medicamentivorans]|uniref:Aldehyde dehydrogenase n=1 Tax=Patulibacter medicamentivorans TaxID=1097667 RepID=H0E2V8_9ACTN|nr:aldehyde dehydrogenase family protein [Patulibacter medicamentivorans]EHN11975.1 Aldehyde dehydrogenase [Patulibacter medicamentivorans]
MSTTTEQAAATLLIDGQWRDAAEHYERVDPADPSRVTGRYAAATAADVGDAYAAAARAQVAWAARPVTDREAILRRAGDLLEQRVEAATAALVDDIGKAHRDARGEVLRGAAILRFHAGAVLQASGETYDGADPSTLLLTLSEPVGVVGAITPWNFPVAIPLWKLAPALAYGNAVVWKPAEAASGSAVLLARLLSEAGLPDGVLNLVTGSGRALSEPLTKDPALAALTFTGSVGVGLRLRAALADRTTKLQLELGGKNPAIVLADADLPDAIEQIARGAMLQAGQRCTATSRVYVDRGIHDAFVAGLVERVRAFAVGDPRDPATDIGPLASREQRDTVEGYLAQARDGAATIACGGSPIADGDGAAWKGDGRAAGGHWVQPTVLTDVADDHPLVREEIFGPVVCVTAVDGFDDALARANDSEFGLSSAVFTRDLATALRFARGTRSGLVHVNRETAGVEPHLPFGGVKASSSMNREQGMAARDFFSVTKTVYIRPR